MAMTDGCYRRPNRVGKLTSSGKTPSVRSTDDRDGFDQKKAALVAIDHAAFKGEQVIKGKKFYRVIQLLLKQRPDLRKAVELTWPCSSCEEW